MMVTLASGADPVASSLNTVQVVSLLLGTLYPIIVGLVTKSSTAPRLKSLLLVTLSAVSGFGFEYLNSANFHWQQALLTTVMTFVTAICAYYGLLKPTGVTAKAQATLVK